MSTRPIYLDNLATTRIDPRVLAEMLPWLDERYGNASSTTHPFGWEAANAVEAAREDVADLLGVDHSSDIFFTSGATESNNTILQGMAQEPGMARPHLVTTAIEHPSILAACGAWNGRGVDTTLVKPDREGIVAAESIARALRPATRLVSVMLANNEVGSIQPIEEILRITRAHGVPLHVDAAQGFGKTAPAVGALGVDFASVSSHKIYGPKGVGAFYVRRNPLRRKLTPLLHGGGQESGMRSGTLPVAQIVGFGAAARLAAAEWRADAEHAAALRSLLWRRLEEEIPEIHLNGSADRRLPGCLNFSVEGVLADAVISSTPELALSSGSACSSHHGGGSHVLRAMGLDPVRRQSALRIGIGRFNTRGEIERAGALLVAAIQRQRATLGRRPILATA